MQAKQEPTKPITITPVIDLSKSLPKFEDEFNKEKFIDDMAKGNFKDLLADINKIKTEILMETIDPEYGFNVFLWSIIHNNEGYKELLNINPSFLACRGREGHNAFILAIYYGHQAIVMDLLKRNENFLHDTLNGINVVEIALSRGHTGIAEELKKRMDAFAKKALPKFEDEFNKEKFIDDMIKGNFRGLLADINKIKKEILMETIDSEYGFNVFLWSIIHNNEGYKELLNINPSFLACRGREGHNAFILAIYYGHQAIVTDLLKRNENFLHDTLNGINVVEIALSRGHIEIAEELKKRMEAFAKHKLIMQVVNPSREGETRTLARIFSFLLTPQQIMDIRLTNKLWKSVVEQIPYLGLNKGLQLPEKRTAIAIAPVNSSGDTYHLLAFTILSLHSGFQVPSILLAYDKEPNARVIPNSKELNTGDQVKRSIQFAEILGYGEFFKGLRVEHNNSGQPSARQKCLVNGLTERNIKHYVDNRITTSIIADFFRTHGFIKTTTILRKGFDTYSLPKKAREQVELYVSQQIKNLKALVSKTRKPTIIIHYRVSGKTHKEQDLSSLAPHLVKIIKDRYNVVGIYADSRSRGVRDVEGSDLSMRPFQDELVKNGELDLGKICHLQLLLRLFEIRDVIRLQGIIGNTSGTLDLAAFIGHRIFNIHIFGASNIDYQDFRLMLQSTFLTIQNAVESNIMGREQSLLVENFISWLEGRVERPRHHSPLVAPTSFSGLGKKGFSFLSSVFSLSDGAIEAQSFIISFKPYIFNRLIESNFLNSGQAAIIATHW